MAYEVGLPEVSPTGTFDRFGRRKRRVTYEHVAGTHTTYEPFPGTRFERELVPNNIFDQLQVIRRKQGTLIDRHRHMSRERRRQWIHARVPTDVRYEFTVDFSPDDGVTFTDPLVQPDGNRVYQMRLRFTQHVNDERDMLQGVALRWHAPPGWTFVDGLGQDDTLYEECVSNPMVVTRVVRSPQNPEPAGFRIHLVKKFRG